MLLFELLERVIYATTFNYLLQDLFFFFFFAHSVRTVTSARSAEPGEKKNYNK